MFAAFKRRYEAAGLRQVDAVNLAIAAWQPDPTTKVIKQLAQILAEGRQHQRVTTHAHKGIERVLAQLRRQRKGRRRSKVN